MRAPCRITGHVFTALDCVLVEIAEGGCIGRGEAAGVYYLDDTPERGLGRSQAGAAASGAALRGVPTRGGAANRACLPSRDPRGQAAAEIHRAEDRPGEPPPHDVP